MGQISLTTPAVGSPRGAAEGSINSDLGTIQTVINGNLDDSNLRSPDGAVRKLLLEGHGILTPSHSVGNWYFSTPGAGGTFLATAQNTSTQAPLLWIPDAGYSSQPQDFQVANKTSFVRLRALLFFNPATPTAGTYQALLSPMTGVGGFGGITFTFALPIGNAVLTTTPTASTGFVAVSAPIAMPTAASPQALGLGIAIPNMAAGSYASVHVQLYGYAA